MNDLVKIKVYSDKGFLKYLVYNKIYYKGIVTNNDSYIIITNYSNYFKIIKRYKCEIIKYYGKLFVINFILINKYMIISFVIGLILLYNLCNTIFRIDINVDKTKEEYMSNILSEYGISKYKKKKSFEELQVIKESILNVYNDSISWIEIEECGVIYEVNVNFKVNDLESVNYKSGSNIISSKNGVIKYINSTSGVKLKEVNDYVKKGEILISGEVKYKDNVIERIKSSGNVYAEVWYIVRISVPFEYIEYKETNKYVNHIYINLFGKDFTIMGKYDSNMTIGKKKLIIDKPYLPFKIYKERKTIYEYNQVNISEKEAYDEAIKRSEKIIQLKLDRQEHIISKNVLKKEVFSSKIELEIFFKVYENIALEKSIEGE